MRKCYKLSDGKSTEIAFADIQKGDIILMVDDNGTAHAETTVKALSYPYVNTDGILLMDVDILLKLEEGVKVSNEKKDNGLCTACAGNGYVRISKGTNFFNGVENKPIMMLHTLSLCPFCKGTGNSDISKKEDKTILKKHNSKEWIDHELTANEYQELASRTINKDLSPVDILNHALFGMVGEVGEIHSIFQKELQGHPIDLHDLKNEVGDLLWFVSELCTYYDWSLSDIMAGNIKKLMERYPDGFEYDRSVNREDYAKQEEIKKALTYGDIFSKCMEQHPELKGKVSDYRPADPTEYGFSHNDGVAIIIWLKDATKILYRYNGVKSDIKFI